MNGLCSREQLELALAGLLNASDELTLHRHLEECELCSAELERLSGGEQASNEIASMLIPDELDDALPLREESSTADFVVEHLEPSDDPAVLGRLGCYDVLDVIGRGGMGVVLKGFDRELKRFVAIKALAPHLAHSALARKRFAREAQAAAAVVNLHVIAIHQVQPNGQLPFLVMPLLTGESLAQRLKSRGNLDLKEILRIGMQAAEGLAAAHEQGLIHRDVKPANILLEKGVERAVLTDFGLARAADDVSMTRWGIIAGTPEYMSPEQARGETLDSRSDLFSMGCVLYEMATGVSPFRTDSSMATMRRLVHETPKSMASLNPELPPWFISIVDRLLEKEPTRRFGSAKEVSELLEGCLAHVQQPTSVPLPAALPKPAHRPAWWLPVIRFKGTVTMIATLGIGLLGICLLSAAPPDITGEWSGEEWGQILLTKGDAGEYTGTYSDTVGKPPGEIQLKWSRIERRFNGIWREGEDRFGELSLRLTGNEIRGALTTDPKSKINPATPRLADLTWIKAVTNIAQDTAATFGPVIEREILFHGACLNLATGKLSSMPDMPLAAEARRMHGDVFQPATENSLDTLTILDVRLLELDQLAWSNLSAMALEKKFSQAAVDHRASQPHSETRIPPGVYGIKTSDKTGLLQVLGTTGPSPNRLTGVKIRYKLVQGGETKTAASANSSQGRPAMAATPIFGPVMKRVLPSGVPCREQYFQFRSGEVFIVGNGPGTSKEEAAYDEKKIEDAGDVDLSANSNEERIVISGRGCIFTRDVETLKWDSFTAEQAVHAMKRVRHVDGEVTPTKEELPITYLFKTARGEVGLMEVMGVMDVKRDGWIEKGMKFRYKLVQGTGASTAVATPPLVFGPESNGLRAAVEVTPGEPFKLRIHIRNVSDRGISIDGAGYRQDDECLLTDAQGRPVPITKVPLDIRIGMKGGYFGAGQVAVFESAGLSFQSLDKAPSSAGYVAQQSKPGRYTLRFRIRLPGDDVPFAAGEHAWKGELETGPVTIEVKDPATQPVAPVADSIWSSVLGPVVERTVNDLQTTHENCALSFDSGKLLPVPANITLETLTNPSAQPVAVAWARDNQADAVAFVTTDAGKVVKCGLLCPGLVVLRANNPEWNPDDATPRDLKEHFDQAMHDWNKIPPIAEVTSDEHFPATFMILDTRMHRRGVLQIMGVTDLPRGVKIRYRLVEGAPVKKISHTAQPTAP